MDEIITYMLFHGLTSPKQLVIIPPPPSDALAWKARYEENNGGVNLARPPKTNEINRKYYDACVELAKNRGIDVVEHWDDLLDKDNFNDGLHFSKKGSEVLFKWVQVIRTCTCCLCKKC